MAIDNVYDLYNATLAADKPTVDAIVAAIKVELEAKIGEEENVFDFELTPHFDGIADGAVNRITDMVIRILRNAGIRAMIMVSPTNTDTGLAIISPYFNNFGTPYTHLRITWYTRNAQEFMKTYV